MQKTFENEARRAGREEGLQQKAKEIALALKKKHLTEEEISLITGLPVEDIARL